MNRTEAMALTATFIDNRVERFISPIEKQINQFNYGRRQYVSTQLTREENLTIHNFERALQEQAKSCEKAMRRIFSVTQALSARDVSSPESFAHATWEDVLKEADRVRETWEDKAKKPENFFRRQARNMGNYAKLANPWIDLLPGGDYGAILCGGLKLVFGAAIAESEARNQIMDCLQALPDRIEEANHYLTVYEEHIKADIEQNFKLKMASMKLSAQVLTAIEFMIKYFDKRGLRRGFEAFLKQGRYKVQIGAIVDGLNMKSDELRRLAHECHEKVVMDTLKEIQKRPTTAELEVVFKNALFQVLHGWLANSEWHAAMNLLISTRYSIPLRPSDPVSQVCLSTDSIKRFLDIDHTMIDRALNRSLTNGPGDGLIALAVIQQLAHNGPFSMWLHSNQSGLILLNRNSDNSGSAFSYFASALISSLRNFHDSIPVHYFCPVWDQDNPSPGSYHMLRSIILQLLPHASSLTLMPQDLSEPVISFPQLYRLFFRCLEAILPGKTVFVIIDGIARHAAEDENEALQIVRLLDQASKYQLNDVRVKVLLTPPVTLEVVEAVSEDSMIMLTSEARESSDAAGMQLGAMFFGAQL